MTDPDEEYVSLFASLDGSLAPDIVYNTTKTRSVSLFYLQAVDKTLCSQRTLPAIERVKEGPMQCQVIRLRSGLLGNVLVLVAATPRNSQVRSRAETLGLLGVPPAFLPSQAPCVSALPLRRVGWRLSWSGILTRGLRRRVPVMLEGVIEEVSLLTQTLSFRNLLPT